MIDKTQILIDLKRRLQDNDFTSINNNANEFSDYDILIILNNNYTQQDEDRILDMCYDVDLKYNILIDSHLLSIKEIDSKRGKQAIFVNALKNGIYA